MSTLPSDEVAEDYRTSLEDLISNDRYQISTLTLIAKENVEHAEAISRVLQNHITRTPPSRKLPALYVLDSVVKNVGSPYNVYFGRNLYQTFMGAYSQVDEKVRRKLEEMLRTWREPVPGSSTTTPVFPLSTTQSIVDNLTKLRAAAAPPPQRYQQTPTVPMPSRTTALPTYDYRSTPTPPQTLPTRLQTSSELPTTSIPASQAAQQAQQPLHAQQWRQPHFQPFQPGQPPSHNVDLAKLHGDIDDLTTDAKIECATHPMDQVAQNKLTTLQTLKEILEAGISSPSEIVDIRMSIDQQLAKKTADKSQAALKPLPTSQAAPYQPPLPPYSQTVQQPLYPAQPYPYSQSQTTQQAPAPVLTTNLAELLRQHAEQAKTPSTIYSGSHNQPAPVVRPSAEANNTAEPPIIAALRAQGLLSATPTPPQILTPPIAGLAVLTGASIGGVTFTSTFIKIPQPQMVASFLSANPNQCSTCGRRFASDEQGREKKARHLDWHFKTKTRMMEAEKRGQNRSWYIDEREWIASREQGDDMPEQANGVSSVQKKKANDFVRVPGDPALRNASCPIDQEPFQSEWSEELQDFIWKDAMKVGNKYYHASCFKEVTKSRDKDAASLISEASGLRTGTPDSVLGKRKAEQEANGAKSRVKSEVY
ncbi:hypothetical protein DV738_g4200, partial [Chaetothyriales sp. CBS 135597]